MELACASLLTSEDRALVMPSLRRRAPSAGRRGGRGGRAHRRGGVTPDRGECSVDELERLARDALPLLEAAGDDDGLLASGIGLVRATARSRFADWAQATEESLSHGRLAGHRGAPMLTISIPIVIGPRPANEALAKLDALIPEAADSKVHVFQAVLLRCSTDSTRRGNSPCRPKSALANSASRQALGPACEIAALAGDDEKAADYQRLACKALEESRRISELSPFLPVLGRYVWGLGRYDEAEEARPTRTRARRCR